MTGFVDRLIAVLRALVATHVDQAKREFSADATRIGIGIALLALAVAFLTVTFLLVDVGAILLLHDIARLEWWAALVIVASVNAALALVFALVARARLARPVLVETRALAKRTAGILRGSAGSV